LKTSSIGFISSNMGIHLEKSWLELLHEEFGSAYFLDLEQFLHKERNGNVSIYPPEQKVYSAFNLCHFLKTKVVILGQDPYHGPNQAHGLCFSVNEGIPHPPSLQNIFKELQREVGLAYPKSGDLRPWAEQGVLLLNATLTVRQGEAGSHQGKGWEIFTDRVIELVNVKCEGVVFLLWGGFAKKKGKMIDRNKHLVLESGHPSPLSANRGYWFGNNHFIQCNDWLIAKGQAPIDWKLV